MKSEAVDTKPGLVPGLLQQLSANDVEGLSSAEAAKRLQHYGSNEILEKKRSPIVAFLRHFSGQFP